MHRSLTEVASLVGGAQALGPRASVIAARGLSSCGSWAPGHRLNCCGTRTLLLRSMWNLPESGIKLMSPALLGRFLSTVPPGKVQVNHFKVHSSVPFSALNAVQPQLLLVPKNSHHSKSLPIKQFMPIHLFFQPLVTRACILS